MFHADMNECKEDPWPCDPNADCFNTDGYFFCVCTIGYTGNGSQCTMLPTGDYVLILLRYRIIVLTLICLCGS